MAAIVPVDDAADPRLADYRQLRDVALRRSLEARAGLFLAEGELVIRRALAAGYRPRSFLVDARRADALADVLGGVDAPCYVVPAAVARAVAGFPVHRGALASMERRALPTVAEVVAAATRILVLEDLVDHTNVGACVRCAAAFDFDAVVLAPRCADPLYRRAVKVSTGAVFTLPYARMDSWPAGLAELRSLGFVVLALTPDRSAEPIEHVVADLRARPGRPRVALAVGTEGTGLSDRWLAAADRRVRISTAERVDSLNVAAAAAVACYLVASSTLAGPADGAAGRGGEQESGR